MQPAQCVLLFLVLAGNSALLRFLCSYTLTLVACSYALLTRAEHVCASLLVHLFGQTTYLKRADLKYFTNDSLSTRLQCQ